MSRGAANESQDDDGRRNSEDQLEAIRHDVSSFSTMGLLPGDGRARPSKAGGTAGRRSN